MKVLHIKFNQNMSQSSKDIQKISFNHLTCVNKLLLVFGILVYIATLAQAQPSAEYKAKTSN